MLVGLQDTVWLIGGLFEGLIFFWPVSLVLLAHAAVAGGYTSLVGRNVLTPALLVPFIWPMLVVAIAGSCRYSGPVMGAPIVPIAAVEIVLAVQVLLSLGIIYQLKGRRWWTTSVTMIAGWLGVISLFLAQMALTNKWL